MSKQNSSNAGDGIKRLTRVTALAVLFLFSNTASSSPISTGELPSSTPVTQALAGIEPLVAQGRVTEALQVLDRILIDNPDDRLTLYTKARLLARTGSLSDAQDIVDLLMQDDPPATVVLHLQGYILSRKGDWDAALPYYRQVYAVGHDGYIMRTMIQAYLNVEGADATLDFVNAHLEQHPAEHNVRLMRAKLYQREQRYTAAAEDYAFLKTALPDNPAVWKNMADLMLEQQDPRALANAREAMRLAPGIPEVQHTLGLALTKFGDPGEAARVLEAAYGARPEDSGLGYDYAVALAKSGADDEARLIMARLAASDSPVAASARKYLDEQ